MRSGVSFLPMALCLLIFSGCAAKLPKTAALDPAGEKEAQVVFANFLAAKRPAALDADLRLGWDVLGSKGAVAAALQLQPPASLRFTANDPLGRAFLLAVSDGTSFTLVDNRIGHVYRGRTDSKFWHSYVPEAVAPDDLYFFLAGFLPAGEDQAFKSAQDPEKTGFWYVWRDERSMTHHVLLDRRTAEMRRHLLFDAGQDLVLDLTYSQYSKNAGSGFIWPGSLLITGEAVTGTLTVQTEKIYPQAQLGAATFRLAPPPHFTVEQVP